jgi:hypothetical protein
MSPTTPTACTRSITPEPGRPHLHAVQVRKGDLRGPQPDAQDLRILVAIRACNGKYVSLAGHLDRLAAGIYRGAKIGSRDKVIGYAGDTGEGRIPVGPRPPAPGLLPLPGLQSRRFPLRRQGPQGSAPPLLPRRRRRLYLRVRNVQGRENKGRSHLQLSPRRQQARRRPAAESSRRTRCLLLPKTGARKGIRRDCGAGLCGGNELRPRASFRSTTSAFGLRAVLTDRTHVQVVSDKV